MLLAAAAVAAVTVCVTVADKDAAGFVVPNAAELQESAKDLAKRLGKQAKKGVAVADNDCRLTARVTYRGMLEGAPVVTAHHGYGLTTKATPKTPIVRVDLVLGEHVVPFEGRGLPDNPFAGFGRAASELSDQIVAWIEANREALK
jgi:hypothetical protein